MRDAQESANKELSAKQGDQMSKLQFNLESKSMRANVAEGSRDSQADVERAISQQARSGLDAAKRSIGSSDANEQARGWAAAKLCADSLVDSQNRLVKTASQSGFDQIDQCFQRERQQLERETRPLQTALVQQQAQYNITLADNSAVKVEMLKAALKVANERARIDMAELQARFEADRKVDEVDAFPS